MTPSVNVGRGLDAVDVDLDWGDAEEWGDEDEA